MPRYRAVFKIESGKKLEGVTELRIASSYLEVVQQFVCIIRKSKALDLLAAALHSEPADSQVDCIYFAAPRFSHHRCWLT